MHHGRIVKRTGDGTLVEFRSVVDAVRCAIEVQTGMVERNAGLPPNVASSFASAFISATSSRRADGDLMGDGVNVAARLEGICEPGAVCLSEDAYRQVEGATRVSGGRPRPQSQLKNIAERTRAIRLTSARRTSGRLCRPRRSKNPARRASRWIVLPFANIGGEPEHEHFVDGGHGEPDD